MHAEHNQTPGRHSVTDVLRAHSRRRLCRGRFLTLFLARRFTLSYEYFRLHGNTFIHSKCIILSPLNAVEAPRTFTLLLLCRFTLLDSQVLCCVLFDALLMYS